MGKSSRNSRTSEIERRFLPLENVELRAAGDGRTLDGYAAVFNVETIIFDMWREDVAPGAFAKTIQEHDIRALWNHDPNVVLGRNKAGTLQLSEDARGLKTVIQPPDNEWGRPVLDAVKRGDVTGMSISFRAVKQEWVHPPEGSRELPKRTIREAKLYDVSPVTFPAFEATSLSVRAAGTEPESDEVDVLARARVVAQCARLGMPLETEDRVLIAAAIEMLRATLPIAEPEPGHHSAGATTDEPDPHDGHHSRAARARELELLGLLCG